MANSEGIQKFVAKTNFSIGRIDNGAEIKVSAQKLSLLKRNNQIAADAGFKIKAVFDNLRAGNKRNTGDFAIGVVDKKLRNAAISRGIEVNSDELIMEYKSITHSHRADKVRDGKAVSEQDLIDFPKKRLKLPLYFEVETKRFIYVDGNNIYIVDTRMNRKHKKGVFYITSEYIPDIRTITNSKSKYEKI